jgi:uncharacterized protein DUF3147
MATIVQVSTSGLKLTKWYEYAIRFGLGGLVTVVAGLIAKKFGACVGGLFLAFPAILAASTTLVEKHEREKKEEKGLQGLYRGRDAAGADAAGAAMGSFGLMTFAFMVWKLLPNHSAWVVIAGATLVWAVVAVGVWWLWKRNHLSGVFRSRKIEAQRTTEHHERNQRAVRR